MKHVVSEKNESCVELTKDFSSVKQEEYNNEDQCKTAFNCINNISKIMKKLNKRHN